MFVQSYLVTRYINLVIVSPLIEEQYVIFLRNLPNNSSFPIEIMITRTGYIYVILVPLNL